MVKSGQADNAGSGSDMLLRLTFKSLFLALMLIFALGWGVYLFLAALIDKVNSIPSDLGKTLIASSVTILVAVITLVAGKILEQRIRIREEIRAKKIPVYEKLIQTYFRIFYAPKTGTTAPSQEELVSVFADFAQNMIVWGSCDVIRAWNEFRTAQFDQKDMKKNLDRMETFFRAVRRDIGNDVRCLKQGDLVSLFVNDYHQN